MSFKTCIKCNKEIKKSAARTHARWCGHTLVKNLMIDVLCKCENIFKTKSCRGRKYCSNECSRKYSLTTELRETLSLKRKNYLENNPDKHPWKNKNKKQSYPCKLFKEELIRQNILFEEELTPIKGRYFALDIAFPEKRIAIEINGNQHYNADKSLKQYYQKRHDLFELNGWNVIELHYSIAYNYEKMLEVIEKLKNDCASSITYDFSIERKEKKKNKFSSKEERSAARKLSSQRIEDYRQNILQSSPGKWGWVSRAARLSNVSHTSISRIINDHLQEFKQFLR